MNVEISNSDGVLLRIPVGTAILIAVILMFLIFLSISAVRNHFQKRNPDSTVSLFGGRKNCDYSECKELIKKDLHYTIISFSIVLIFICVILLTGDQSAMDYFSFASTITSIVLSVVAIIMTISSESKSESVKHQIDKSVKELGSAKAAIEKYNTSLDNQAKVFEQILEKSEKILKITESLDEQMEKIKPVFSENMTINNERFRAEEDIHS